MKIRYFTNIPSPYRINFFNELGKECDLEVIFEAEKAPKINTDWYKNNNISNFTPVFLKKGTIEEKKINLKILKYVIKNSDLLVFTNYSYFTEMFALIVTKILRKKYILQIDGGIISHNESFLKNKLKKFLISNAYCYLSPSKESDNFLIYYGALKEKINRYYFTSLYKNDIIEHPVENKDKQKAKKDLMIKENKIILSVGQFIYRKGFDWMIDAYKNLDKEIGIYIIGGAATQEYLDLKNKYKMDNLHFIDFMNKNEILKWYRAADLFVLPTREDIWGLVINEALAQGLPTVTTDKCIAGLELIVNKKNGFIIKCEDEESLLQITESFFEKSEADICLMKKEALSIIKKYTIENMAKNQLDVIKKVLEMEKNDDYI